MILLRKTLFLGVEAGKQLLNSLMDSFISFNTQSQSPVFILHVGMSSQVIAEITMQFPDAL
jgi:hypothetical protein